jgi:hypothetical protein
VIREKKKNRKRRKRKQVLTEAVKNIEKYNKKDRYCIHKEAGFAHPEWPRRHIFTTGYEVASKWYGVGNRAQNNKGTSEVEECRTAA